MSRFCKRIPINNHDKFLWQHNRLFDVHSRSNSLYFNKNFLYIYEQTKNKHLKLLAQILAFYMFFGSLIPNSDFSQLTRVADMMEHFQLHQEEVVKLNVDFSFWEFLKIHFITPNDHEHDGNDDHQNCPFQSFCPSLNFVLSTDNTAFAEAVSTFIQEDLIYNNTFHLSGFVTTEIQPPSFS